MKKINSIFLAAIISFYGITVLSPSLVFANNDSNGKNEIRQEAKQIKQEIKSIINFLEEEGL